MPKTRYQLSGGDGGAYGPCFGPVRGIDFGEIEVDGSRRYMVVRLDELIQEEGQDIEYFVVAPRYTGDTLETIRDKGCVVGVSIILPGKIEEVMASGMSSDNTKYWAIGECKKISA